jgi:C_GCAxxG_C_C family probable redox protein
MFMHDSDTDTVEQPQNHCRRRLLKLSLAAGAAMALQGVPRFARAATAKSAPANRPKAAEEHFLKSMNCSQAILETYGPALGLDAATARRLGTGFAGGMGTGSDCGALTGAVMALGLKHGPATDKTLKQVGKLIAEFKVRHAHAGCSQLLGSDMGTQKGVEEAAARGYFTSRCPNYVRSAAEILEKLLA